MKAITSIEGENFTHRYLWRVVDRQLNYAKENAAGSLYDDLVAMVFAFLSFEAYLNFLGERIAPAIWENERRFFSKEPYRGFAGKLRKIFEVCELNEPDRTRRPFSTIWQLKDVRDIISHGKIESFAVDHELSPGEEPLFFPGRFESLISHDKACEAREDVHAIAKLLHDAAQPKNEGLWFGADPFSGALGYSTGHTSVIPE